MQFNQLLTQRTSSPLEPSYPKVLSQNSKLVKKYLKECNLIEAADVIIETFQMAQDDKETSKFANKYVQKICSQAISMYSDQNQLIQIFKYIENAFKHNQTCNRVLIDIYNHLACCYRKMQNFKEAHKYLSKCLKRCQDGQQKAQTYLNMCSIQSQQGDHLKAKHSACQAIDFIMLHLQNRFGVEDYIMLQSTDKQIPIEIIQILAASQYNLAVELEFLKNISQSIKYY